MKYQPVAKIRYQSDRILNYSVASKSSMPGESHQLSFRADGTRECSCIGNKFIEKKGDDMFRDCRHKKLVTIYAEPHDEPMSYWYEIQTILNGNKHDIAMAWGSVVCANPEYYHPMNIYCKDCPLYPDVCNIHKMRVPGKRNTLPMVWRLQGHIYKGERKKAAKLLRKIIKEIERRLHE